MGEPPTTAPTHPSRFRHWLNAAGTVLTLVALVAVGFAVERSFGRLGADLTSPAFVAAVAAGSIGYALLLLLLPFAWQGVLAAIDGPNLGLGPMLAIYARTQIYKYLPSNLLHMVGRYVEAHAAGASHAALAVAQAAELVLLSAAGALVAALLALPLLLEQAQSRGLGGWVMPLAIAAGVVLAALVAVALPRLATIIAMLHRVAPRAVMAFALYVLFVLGSGALAWALAASLGGLAGAPVEIVGIAAAAWLIGFVVPGAPGGLGVRDAVLIAGLAAADIPGATAIALGHRIITTLGDTLLALVGFAISRRR